MLYFQKYLLLISYYILVFYNYPNEYYENQILYMLQQRTILKDFDFFDFSL